MFDERIDYFKTQLAQKLYDDMSGKQTLNEIKNKVHKILPYENFYTFKIFPNENDKNAEERKELLRLITDA